MADARASLPFLHSKVRSRARKRPGPGLVATRSAVRMPEVLQPPTGVIAAASTPHLFVHEGSRQQLEKRLRTSLGKRIRLAITDNRRTMVSARVEEGTTVVRVHHMFLDADDSTQFALCRYLKDGERLASEAVGAYIDANQQRIRPLKRPGTVAGTAKGQRHDLQASFDRINDEYFQGMVDATIRWGRRTTPRNGERRTSIKLGTYCAHSKMIRIHPALDQDWVPRYFVEYVVFHEMLHHMFPMPMLHGRRQLHTPELLAAERRFRHYARALRWEQKNLGRLLRAH